jgi:thioredoxin 1
MAGANVKEFTDGNFEAEVLKSGQPVLVDFWAEWCQPCRMLGPTIDTLATKYAGKAKVGKVDIDNNQKVAADYGIMAIPTVLVFKGGQIVKRFQGLTSEAVLSGAIDAAVG